MQVNLTTNSVARVYNLGSEQLRRELSRLLVGISNTDRVSVDVTLAVSLIDDIRFNPATGFAYITDAGAPALIVLDLATGEAGRVLEDDPTTKGFMPPSAEVWWVYGVLLRFE